MIQLTSAVVSYPNGGIKNTLLGAFFPKKYKHKRKNILNKLTLWLGRGESFALLGSDDEARLALLRLVAGFIPPDEGHCSVEGKVASVIRGEDGLIGTETGESNALLAYKLQRQSGQDVANHLNLVEEMSGLGLSFRDPVNTYDESKRARLAMSIALAQNPDIIVISNMLERCGLPYTQRYVVKLREKIKEGTSLLMESTDGALLKRVCESALLIEDGSMIRLGLYDNVYAAYKGLNQKEGVKLKHKQAVYELENQKAAFSDALSPEIDNQPFSYVVPHDEKKELQQARQSINHLNAQLTAYAKANLAFDEENRRLQTALIGERLKAKQGEELLKRVFNSLTGIMDTMHRQFIHLSKIRKNNEDNK